MIANPRGASAAIAFVSKWRIADFEIAFVKKSKSGFEASDSHQHLPRGRLRNPNQLRHPR
jgi:hypothetical protein